MTVNEYQELALRTINPKFSREEQLLNGILGLNGEAGECADLFKKVAYQGHEPDKLFGEKLVGELGDVAWYLSLCCYGLNIPLEDILIYNINKLKERYPDGFSVEKSVNRVE